MSLSATRMMLSLPVLSDGSVAAALASALGVLAAPFACGLAVRLVFRRLGRTVGERGLGVAREARRQHQFLAAGLVGPSKDTGSGIGRSFSASTTMACALVLRIGVSDVVAPSIFSKKPAEPKLMRSMPFESTSRSSMLDLSRPIQATYSVTMG